MSTRRMKLDYNHFVELIDDVLGADDIDHVKRNAWHIGIGFELLNGYLRELAQHAIETDDEWLIEWCKNLLIVTETDDE